MDQWEKNVIIKLVNYFENNSIKERQDNFLVFNPRELRFWIVPVKKNPEENLKMFEGGMSLKRKYEEEK